MLIFVIQHITETQQKFDSAMCQRLAVSLAATPKLGVNYYGDIIRIAS